MASADGLTLPKPAIPKTLGILNVIFAVLLILLGLCVGGITLLAPAIQQFGQRTMAQQKNQAEAQKASDLKVLDDRAKAATTDEEKATIAKERDAVAGRPLPVMPDMQTGTEILKDPRVMGFTVAQIVTGLLLHILLLVSGIGLIRLTPWGRSLALWWAGLQIVQLLILGVVSFMVILPIQRVNTEATLAKLREDLAKPNVPPTAAMSLQMAETMAKLAPVIAVGSNLAGMTYPVICLILLSGAGARAACLRRPPEGYPTGAPVSYPTGY